MTKYKITIKDMTVIAMFTSITAVFSQLAIPLPFTPVPLNLATLSVFIAGGLLGAVRSGISQLIYVLLGAVGLPVFAGFMGGFGIIAGPTGGYIVGYIIAAFVIGLCMLRFPKTILGYSAAMLIGLICCYILGTIWFMLITRTELLASISMCVLPFLPGDFIKIAIAAFLAKRLKNAVPV